MVFTTSKDSTLKGFFYDSLTSSSSEYDYKIDHSVNNCNYTVKLNHSLFGTYANDSS